MNDFINSPPQPYVDGRTLKRTGRTAQFCTKVHPSFKNKLHKMSKITGKNYNQIIEESLDLYIKSKN